MMNFEVYISLLMGTGLISVWACFLLFKKTGYLKQNGLLFFWFVSRFLSDLICFSIDRGLGLTVYPVFHISIFIEFELMIFFYLLYINGRWFYKILLLSIPLIVLIFDCFFIASIFQDPVLAAVIYYLMISIFFIHLILNNDLIEKSYLNLLSAFMTYHVLLFFYSIFINQISSSDFLMATVYPLSLICIVGINLYIFYFQWSLTKN